MTIQVEWHEEATREYSLHIAYYLEEAGPDVAVRFVEAIDDAVAHIVEAPTRWRRLDERVRAYSIVYWPADDARLYVVAVEHGERRPEYWRARI